MFNISFCWAEKSVNNVIVDTTTLHLSTKFCKSCGVSKPLLTIPTIGFRQDSSTIPYSFSNPSVINFCAICVLSESEGTETRSFLQQFEISVANIVSVLPVPVGITTIALSSAL